MVICYLVDFFPDESRTFIYLTLYFSQVHISRVQMFGLNPYCQVFQNYPQTLNKLTYQALHPYG